VQTPTLNALSPLLARAGRNLALAKPILDLRDGQKKQQSKIHDAVKKLYLAKLKEENATWESWISWKSLIILYCRGEYYLQKNPRTPGYYVRPMADAANRQKSANLINTYRHMCLSKITSTQPNVRIGPGDDDPRSIASVQNARPMIDYWESQFYKARYSQRSGLHKLNAGISITRVRWNPLAPGPTAARYSIEDGDDFQLGGGHGECLDCDHQGEAGEFQSPDLEYGAQCPQCASNAVDVSPPAKAPMSQVKQSGTENFGAPEISLVPLESCRWDLTGDFEVSDWGIIRHRITPGDVKLLVGDAILPDTDSSDDKSLTQLRNLAYPGNAVQGAKRSTDKSPTACEFWVSPRQLAELETEGGKTVDGEDLPPGRLDKVYGNKPVCFVGLNDMSLIIGTYQEHTGQEQIVTGQWQVEADSGAGRGIQDAAATQRRYGRWDGHIDQGLAATATPAIAVDKRLLDDDQSHNAFKPGTVIKLNLTQMPPEHDMSRSIHVFTPGAINNQAIEYGQKHLMDMFQLQTFNLEFSDNLMNVDPRTLGGSQLASNLANSLYGPVGQIIGEERVAIAEKIYKLVKRYDPVGRFYPGKNGSRGKTISGRNLEGNLVFELVEDSVVPTTPYTKRQDLGSFVQSMGGIVPLGQAMQTIPNTIREFAKVANVKLEAEDADTVSTICLQRLEQMEEKLAAGVTDPQELVASIVPPPSSVEPKQKEKRDWWSDWLDLPEGLESSLPLRQAAEAMYWLHENNESKRSAALATNAGMVQGTGQAAAMAPAAMGQKMLEGNQAQPDPAQEAEAARQLQEDQHHHEAATQALKLQQERDIKGAEISAEDRRTAAELTMKDAHKEAELKSAERVVAINSKNAAKAKPKAKAK
jgi:hypothetical protein